MKLTRTGLDPDPQHWYEAFNDQLIQGVVAIFNNVFDVVIFR